MNKEEIIQRYYKEKDEGKIFFNGKALLKAYGVIVIVAFMLGLMSILLMKDTTIADIIFILVTPSLFVIYGTRGYYTKEKSNYFIAIVWFVLFIDKIITFINTYGIM